MKKKILLLAAFAAALMCSCSKIDVILDTDANNELDDQHAIAYMLFNQKTFNVLGITTNVTINGGIKEQCEEVERVAALTGKWGRDLNVLPGATGKFEEIVKNIQNKKHDGYEAVDFIVQQALAHSPEEKLTIIPIGKLTNVALAIFKHPEIIPNLRVVWLGSNYPLNGEHNLVNDEPSANYVISSGVQFEMLPCRYQEATGTDAVRVSIDRVKSDFAGKGPKVDPPVTGRHGGQFSHFGDYSVNLFENIHLEENGTRALFDLVAVAIVKNPKWGSSYEIPAPVIMGGQWFGINAKHNIKIWEKYDAEAIIKDFTKSIDK